MPKRSRKRLPIQQRPTTIEVAYYKKLSAIVRTMTQATDQMIPQLEDIMNDLTMDAAPDEARVKRARKRAEALIDQYAERTVDAMRPHELEAVAAQFGKQTSAFQKEQLSRQVRAAASIDLRTIAATEKGIRDSVDGWIASNVDLIKTMPSVYFDDVRAQVFGAIDGGTRHEVLARQLVERYDIPDNRAALIARDQVGKLYGDLNAQRQQNLGVTGYIWRTVRDNRVREDHELRDGEPFTWDSPPDDGHPGEPINCRCYAEPDLSDLSALLDS